MIVCPVCENQQAQGDVCEVCGKQLAKPRVVDLPPTPLAELEGTRLQGVGAVPVAAIAELEGTKLQAGPDLPAQAMPEMERTRTEPAPDMPVEAISDLDRGREVDDGVRTELPVGQVTCRYCRHVQRPAGFCDACGMKLPPVAPLDAPAAAVARRDSDEAVFVICQKCGTRSAAGRRCSACGIPVPFPGEA